MQSIHDKKKIANEHRKSGDYESAIPIYDSLWRETSDPFDGAGLLNCHRKKGDFDKALQLARELYEKHMDHEWAAREVCWSIVQGKIRMFDEKSPLEDVIKSANIVMEHSPDFLARKVAVFSVLKWAKKKKDWTAIAKWIDLIEVEDLSEEPMCFSDGKKGWSDQCLWYNYKTNSLLKRERYDEAREHAAIAIEKCKRQWYFFLRLQARALKGLGEVDSAKKLYEKRCTPGKSQWWLLQDYGNLLNEVGETGEALRVLCAAALSKAKLEMKVRLFSDIARIFSANGELKKARAHYHLEKFLREENDWQIPDALTTAITRLDGKLTGEAAPNSKKSALSLCRSIWREHYQPTPTKTLPKTRGLTGKYAAHKEKPFGFVNTKDGFSAICFPSDIQPDVVNGDAVVFDVIPSYDKKNDRERWKAVWVKKIAKK